MKFLELGLHDFGVVGYEQFSFEGNGLVLIDGKNHDTPDHGSNGAGKTSLVPDALSWCLFGKTTRGVTGDAVVRAGSKDGTWVRVVLRSRGRTYQIERFRKHEQMQNRVRLHDITKTPITDLTCSTNPDTEKRIQRLLGVQFDVWMYCIVLGQGLSYRFSSLRDQQRAALLETIIAVTDFDRARNAAKEEVNKITLDLASLDGSISELAYSIEQQQQKVVVARLALEAAEETAAESAAAVETEKPLPALRQKLEEAEEAQKAAQLQVLDRTQLLDSLGHKVSEVTRALTRADAEAERREAEVVRIDELLAKAEAGTCGTCGQSIETTRSDALQSTWTKDRRAAIKRLDALRVERAELKNQDKDLKQQQLSCRRKAAEFEELHDQCRDRTARLRAEIRQLEAATADPVLVAVMQDGLKQEKIELAKLQQRHQEVVSAREKQDEGARYWRWWISGFQQLRMDMLRRVVTFLSARLQHYCAELSGGSLSASVSLHEKRTSGGVGLEVSLDVANHSGTYEGASGGERDRIDLAMAFALHDVAMTTSGFSSNVLVADEVGGFIDPPGVLRAIDLLRKKAEKLDSVFVISQNPEFKSAVYDQRWVVVRKGGVSTMKRQGSR